MLGPAKMSQAEHGMSVGQLTSKYQTKAHFIHAYTQHGKLLPVRTSFGWSFIRQVLSGEKMLLDTKDTDCIQVPPRLTEKAEGRQHIPTLARITPRREIHAVFS